VVASHNGELETIIPPSGLLGYLNFSDGRPDPRWQKQVNDAYSFFAQKGEEAPWTALLAWLNTQLGHLRAEGSAAFRDITQAQWVLGTASEALAAYRRHHSDLLAHLADAEVFGPFFLVRVFEATLAQRSKNGHSEAVALILSRLNDFVGHRPIALLETRPQGEPYEHERHRPLPLYLRGAGVTWGPYHDVVAQALEILAATPTDLLADACLDLDLLDELAIDLRAYDHGHPANRRPNYVFGEWDPHHIDNQGRFRRYVARKITLDALLSRVAEEGPIPRGERLWEAAAVLAGTILMATGVSGWGPSAHDSSATLATLLPRIARNRDRFYEQLLDHLKGPHAARLRHEQTLTRQPFGGARQHLNTYLARHRAAQLQQRCLALLFAQMGYPEASQEQARRIPAVSTRMLSEMLGQLTTAHGEARRGELEQAAQRLPLVEDLLHRGIACGALADPWNLLGFNGLYPLSPAREDSVRDARLDELVHLMDQIFSTYARLMSEAAATGNRDLVDALNRGLEKLAEWWDQFATSEVGDLRKVQGRDALAARQVARALGLWHERGEATADLAFWRDRLDTFRSPKAFALVVDALLAKADFKAALGLLACWLGQAEQIPLEEGIYSFHGLALRWMLALCQPEDVDLEDLPRPDFSPAERQTLAARFLDQLEANAEDYWQVPTLGEQLPMPREAGHQGEEAEEEENLFGAAYDEVTYQDSTGDDEGAVIGNGGPAREFGLQEYGDLVEKRLRFQSTLARLWQVGARYLAPWAKSGDREEPPGGPETQDLHIYLGNWLTEAESKKQGLLQLLDSVHAYPVPEPSGDYDSLVEYDRQRVFKEQLLYSVINTCLDMSLAVSVLRSATARGEMSGDTPADAPPATEALQEGQAAWEPWAIRLEAVLMAGDPEGTRDTLARFVEHFRAEPLLFTPLTEGGPPRPILRVRIAQTILRALLANLPRLGLIHATFDLLRTAREMEVNRPAPHGRGITDFNHFFQSAFQATVECVVDSSSTWPAERQADPLLVQTLERLTAPFLALWVEHSRTLQLSILETVQGEAEWRRLQDFVRRYGGDLFHARFMTLANLRGILHRGVGAYLDYLQENEDPLHPILLLEDLGRAIPREEAETNLRRVLQAVVENYEEYKDYNTTTTQSDYGENLHVLLDFLRIKTSYERNAWQFRPLVMVHEVLARHGRDQAAILWEQSFTRVTQDLADRHLEQLAAMEKARGGRLSTIADRLQERFVKPLSLDRLCALLEPAMREAREERGPHTAFTRFCQEMEKHTATPSGVGLDVPFWLRRLETEVNRIQARQTTIAVLAENFFRVPRRNVSFEELDAQLREWNQPQQRPT
jgi:hypothetical protein